MDSHQNGPPRIDDEKLVSAYKKALLYAERKVAKFRNSGLISRMSAKDVANEAVAKLLSGERPWRPEVVPDLSTHLIACINSIISNTYTSLDFRKTDWSDPENHILSTQDCSQQSMEDRAEFESKVTFIIEFLANAREDVKQIAELMLKDGVTEPKEIASMLGISVREANNLKLAIKRTMQRANFTLHYISRNRRDLICIANAIYKHKATSADELSKVLQMPAADVRNKRRELYRVIEEIHRGLI